MRYRLALILVTAGCSNPLASSAVSHVTSTDLVVSAPTLESVATAVAVALPDPPPSVPPDEVDAYTLQRYTWSPPHGAVTVTNASPKALPFTLYVSSRPKPYDIRTQTLLDYTGGTVGPGQERTFYVTMPICGEFQMDVAPVSPEDVQAGRVDIRPGFETQDVLSYVYGDTGVSCVPPETDCQRSVLSARVYAAAGRLVGTLTFKPNAAPQMITLSSYTTPVFGYSLPQDVVGSDTQIIGASGVYTFSAALPAGTWQGDLYCGPPVPHFDESFPAFPEEDLLACTFGGPGIPVDQTVHCNAGSFPSYRRRR